MPTVIRQYRLLLLLTIIVLFAFYIRFYQNTSNPAGFFCDEAGLSYEAYAIATTGKDSFGNVLPFYFNIFSPRGPIAIYDQVPFIWLFGMNEFASRFAAAFLGTITIIAVFFLTKILTKNKLTAVLAAFLTTISPWHIQFSRFGTENIRVPLYFTLALIFFLLGIKHKKREELFLIFSIISLFFAFYSYSAAALFVLPFLPGIVLIYRQYFSHRKRFSILLLGLIFICSMPFLYQTLAFPLQSRFAEVSVFKNKTIQQAGVDMFGTYIQSYSPDFLFFKGDAGMPGHFINRFSVKRFGELYAVALPFFLLGLFVIGKHIRKKEYQLLLLWLLLYPMGSVVAGADGGGPFATRSIIGVVVFQIITAMGITYLISIFKQSPLKITILVSTIVIFLLSSVIYLYTYFVVYPQYSEDFWGWQYGAKDIVYYFTQQQKYYDDEIMMPEFNASDIFFKFYAPHDCSKCKTGYPDSSLVEKRKQLFAVTPLYLQQHSEFSLQLQKRIVYPNGQTAFLIGEIKKPSDKKRSQ